MEDRSAHSDLTRPDQEAVVPVAKSVGHEEPLVEPTSPREPARSDSPQFTQRQDRAGFWLRLVAFAIDTLILSVFAVCMLAAGLVGAGLTSTMDDLATATAPDFPLLPLWIAGTLLGSAAYSTILCSEHGHTIGKSLLGLEVRTTDGRFLSYSQALFRWLGYGLSFGGFGLGFVWIAISPSKRGWHDLLANTVVIIPRYEQS